MKTINISQFKAHISEELRRVRTGDSITILDRDIPVAVVVPYRQEEEKLAVRPPKHPLVFAKSSFSVGTDPLR
jgi:prevent-host-death family protein